MGLTDPRQDASIRPPMKNRLGNLFVLFFSLPKKKNHVFPAPVAWLVSCFVLRVGVGLQKGHKRLFGFAQSLNDGRDSLLPAKNLLFLLDELHAVFSDGMSHERPRETEGQLANEAHQDRFEGWKRGGRRR